MSGPLLAIFEILPDLQHPVPSARSAIVLFTKQLADMDEEPSGSIRYFAAASPSNNNIPINPTAPGPSAPQLSHVNLRGSEASPSQPSTAQNDPFGSPTRSRPVADASIFGRGHSRDANISQLINGSPSRSPFWSPRARVTYSDRCIPSRATSSRLDFSMLDREIVTAAVSNTAVTREVSVCVGVADVHRLCKACLGQICDVS